MWSNTKIAKYVGEVIPTRHDDRLGLGYGQLKQRFHKPRPADNTFPYVPPDNPELDEIEIDAASHDAVNKKIYNFPRIDPGDARSTDPLYFVGAATKLQACFEHPDEVLAEITSAAKMIPVPGTYSPYGGVNNQPTTAVGGFSSWKAFDERPYKRTGTKRGWSKSPPLSKVASEDEIAEDEFFSLKDLADIQRLDLGECFDFYGHI